MRVILASLGLLVASAVRSQSPAPPAQPWAFVPPQAVAPTVDSPLCQDELDRYVLARLQARGLTFGAVTDPLTLLRRVHLVLTGLPPTHEQIADFLAAPGDQAMAQRVDALLADAACAEHLASDWLDLARFADTYGYQSDYLSRTWPWRDWLLDALHSDKSWPQFATELLAGDLLPEATLATQTATAFWRLHRQTAEGGSIEAEWRHEYIADRVDTFGATFLGLTLGCARCHDHKSDPLSQRDYYSLGSFFVIDENGLYPHATGVTPQPAVRLATAAQQQQVQELRAAAQHAEQQLRAARQTAEAAAVVGVVVLPPPLVTSHFGALECDGDARTPIPGVPGVTRDDVFSIALRVWTPDHKERAVLLHTSTYTQDADTQGYQLLLEDGALTWTLAHHWPGSAIAVRTITPLPLQRWVQVVATYDGSSKAAGLALYLDGQKAPLAIVRDHLAGPSQVRQLELGGRDRDRGFANGRIADFAFHALTLSAAQVSTLAGHVPDAQAQLAHAVEIAPQVVAARAAWQAANKALHAAEERIPELMVMAAHSHPPQRFVLQRGVYDQPDAAQPVTADVPAALLPWQPEWPRDRRGLAQWLLDARNPLPARVVVDRLWATCFGRGLVRTPDNFGTLSSPPLQQDLLDHLALDLQHHGSMRRILRRIVLSRTFAQTSTVAATAREQDPDNEWLARGPSFRLSAEVLRDQALVAAGLLHHRVGGPSSKPYQPPGLWADAGANSNIGEYQPDSGPEAHRRSLYTFRKRIAPPPNQMLLDATSREICTVRRQSTNTPLQTLVFWNDPVFTECAEALAERALAHQPDRDMRLQLSWIFTALATRTATQRERQALEDLAAAAPTRRAGLALAAMTLLASDAVVVLR